MCGAGDAARGVFSEDFDVSPSEHRRHFRQCTRPGGETAGGCGVYAGTQCSEGDRLNVSRRVEGSAGVVVGRGGRCESALKFYFSRSQLRTCAYGVLQGGCPVRF